MLGYSKADTNVKMVKCNKDLTKRIDTFLKNIHSDMIKNGHYVNIGKTEILIIKKKNHALRKITLKLGNNEIKNETEITLLCVTLDQYINFEKHVSNRIKFCLALCQMT